MPFLASPTALARFSSDERVSEYTCRVMALATRSSATASGASSLAESNAARCIALASSRLATRESWSDCCPSVLSRADASS